MFSRSLRLLCVCACRTLRGLVRRIQIESKLGFGLPTRFVINHNCRFPCPHARSGQKTMTVRTFRGVPPKKKAIFLGLVNAYTSGIPHVAVATTCWNTRPRYTRPEIDDFPYDRKLPPPPPKACKKTTSVETGSVWSNRTRFEKSFCTVGL